MAEEKILIVESSDVRSRALSMILGQIGGYEISRSPTVLEALKQIKLHSFDLVLTNTVVQKDLDGIKLAQIVLLRGLVPEPPLIMMATEQKDSGLVRKCRHIGVVDYLIYPYDPETLLQRVKEALGQRQEMSKPDTQQAIVKTLKNILDLPTISQVHDRIGQLLASDGSSAKDVSEVMEIDQSITSKVLQLANSAVFGFNRHISSVKDAVALIGFEQVGDLVTAATTFEALGRVEESPHFNRMAFWEHSIGCGTIAKILADKLGVDPERAFVAGLLHDIGKVVLDGYFPELFAQALQVASTEAISIYEAENKTLPINHEIVGSHLARQWKLPDALTDVIGSHHNLKPQKSMYARLVLLVHVADAQCRLLRVGNAGDSSTWTPQKLVLRRLGISNADLTAWKPEMETEIKKAQGLLQMMD